MRSANYDCIFFWHVRIYVFSSVIVLGFKYWTVELKKIYFIVIIVIVIVGGFVVADGNIIIIR